MATKTKAAHGAWVQAWEESERGWGTRPDGYFYYLTEDAAIKGTQKRENQMRAHEAKLGYGVGNVPEEYSRPCGEPRFVQVSDALLKEIKKKGVAYRDSLENGK